MELDKDINKEDDEIICFCFGVRLGSIREAVRDNNLKGIQQIIRYTRAGGGCRGCQGDILKIIEQTRRDYNLDEIERRKWQSSGTPAGVPVIKQIRLVNEVLKGTVNPHFERFGISFDLDDIKDQCVCLRLQGPSPTDPETLAAWLKRAEAEIQAVLGEISVRLTTS